MHGAAQHGLPWPAPFAGRRQAAVHLQRLHQGAAGGAGKCRGGVTHAVCQERAAMCLPQPRWVPCLTLCQAFICCSPQACFSAVHATCPLLLAGRAAGEGHPGCGRRHRPVQPGAAPGLPGLSGYGCVLPLRIACCAHLAVAAAPTSCPARLDARHGLMCSSRAGGSSGGHSEPFCCNTKLLSSRPPCRHRPVAAHDCGGPLPAEPAECGARGSGAAAGAATLCAR